MTSGDADVRKLAAKRPARAMNLSATDQQLQVLFHPARSQIIYAARRFGKSILAQMRVIMRCRTPNPHGLFWYLVPTYRQGRTPFLNLLRIFINAGLVTAYSRQEMRIELATGWRVEVRSMEVADNARGEGPDECVVDEADQIKDEDFYEVVRPALADKRAPLLAITTPKKGRKGWCYELYRRGDGRDAAYKAWKFTVYDAAFIAKQELEDARAHMPKRAWQQEFMAELLDGSGVVYEEIRHRKRLVPVVGEPVGIGADWAKKFDRTWFVAVGAESGAILKATRLPMRLPYPKQVELLASFTSEFVNRGYYVEHDRTGVGEALDDLLAAYAHTVHGRMFDAEHAEGVVFTHQTKTQLVEESVADFESGRLGFVHGAEDDPVFEAALKEYEDFSLDVSKTGKITYGAPEGLHDDAVSAGNLANSARRKLQRDALEYAPDIWTI